MLKRVLVPLDGSPVSAEALPVIEHVVVGSDAEVTLLMVDKAPAGTPKHRLHDTEPVPVTTSLPGAAAPLRILPAEATGYAEDRGQATKRKENELIDKLRDAAQQLSCERTHVEVRVAFGDPAREIIDLAAKERFDLICMATHGHSGLRDVFRGSVTEAVLRSGVAPVLVVPASRTAQ